MKFIRWIYSETDVNGEVLLKAFANEEEARAHARQALFESVKNIFGEDYKIPPECIDEDGYVELLTDHEEICSCEGAWSIYDGRDYDVRGELHALEMELTSQELESAFRERDHEYLLEDAKNALFCFAGYVEYDEDSEHNQEAEQEFYGRYGFHLMDAVDPQSEVYVLEKAVERFEHYESMDACDNDTWHWAVRESVLETEELVRRANA